MDFMTAMRELESAPGVSAGELDRIKRGILSMAADVATVSGEPAWLAQGAIECAWLAYGGPQEVADEGQRRYARRRAMRREYARRQRARRRRR